MQGYFFVARARCMQNGNRKAQCPWIYYLSGTSQAKDIVYTVETAQAEFKDFVVRLFSKRWYRHLPELKTHILDHSLGSGEATISPNKCSPTSTTGTSPLHSFDRFVPWIGRPLFWNLSRRRRPTDPPINHEVSLLQNKIRQRQTGQRIKHLQA